MTNSALRKPTAALAIATGFGLGYVPLAPGTWGSLLGAALGWSVLTTPWRFMGDAQAGFVIAEAALAIAVSLLGIWAADTVEKYLHARDPQIVVVDEVAGQLIAYLGLAAPRPAGVNWKYLLLGFILFRVFDIWKPFPARRAESLPGGLGVMADDWIAGGYAALALWLVRRLAV